MEKEFCNYNQALALKELHFDEPTIYYTTQSNNSYIYNFEEHPDDFIRNIGDKTLIAAPLKQQVFRWFREKYNLRGFIGFRPNVKKFDYHIYDMSLSGMEYVKQRTMEEYNKDPLVGTYEEAEDACIDKLIEIIESIKTQNNE